MRICTQSPEHVPRPTNDDPPSPSAYIDYIPTETLINVMQLVVSDPDLPHNAFSAALRLSHVSRHFRFIAHGASELWTLTCPTFPLTLNQVALWLDVLERSKPRLIDVVIDVQVESLGGVQLYETFLEEVIGHSDRWRKFEIKSTTWEPIDLFLRQSQHLVLLPGIVELVLHHSEDPGRTDNWEHENPSPRFHNLLFGKDVVAPVLNVIKLGATYFNYSRMRSLAQDLVELRIENHTYPRTSDVPETIIDLLRASQRLQVLILASLNVQFITWPRHVELPRLRRLEFRGSHRSAMHLLSLLRVPALEALCLGSCRFAADPGPDMIPPTFAADETMRFVIGFFVSPENARWCWRAEGLKELSLEYSQCLPREVTRLLRLTINVETFHMSCPDIFSVLTENPGILPNLRHLVVNASVFYDPSNPYSAILANRPGITFSVKGVLTKDGELLYNALKDTLDITLHV